MNFTSDDVRQFLGDISVDTNREGIVDNFCKRAADFLNSVESLTGSKDVSVDGEDYTVDSKFSVFDGGLSKGQLYVSGSFDISDDYTGDTISLDISYIENMVGDSFVELNGEESSFNNIKSEIEGKIQGIQNKIEGSYEKESHKIKMDIKKITEAILNGKEVRQVIAETAKFRSSSLAGDAYLSVLYSPGELLKLFKDWAKASTVSINSQVKVSSDLTEEEKSLLDNINAGNETLYSLFKWGGAEIFEESTGEGYGYLFKIHLKASNKSKLLSSIANKSRNAYTLRHIYFESTGNFYEELLYLKGNEYPGISVNNTAENSSDEDVIELKVDERRVCADIVRGKLPQFDEAYKTAVRSKESFEKFMKGFCLKAGVVDTIIDDFNAAKDFNSLTKEATQFSSIEELFKFYLNL